MPKKFWKMQNEDSPKNRILIVAAEASSSLYAQRLLEHWKNSEFEIEAFGVGSRDMEALGFECLGRSEDMAVVGVSEVLAHFTEIRQVFYRLVEEAKKRKPQVILLLDYPDFNFRLAKALSNLGFKVVYYISPQIWAWRKSRIKLVQKYIDKMLVLFPFEKDFYKSFNVDVEFVGHPLLDEINEELYNPENIRRLRSKYGLLDEDVVLGLMPGSRKSEIKHHLQTQLEAARILAHSHANLKIALLVAPHFDLEEFRSQMPDVDFPMTLIKLEPFQMISLTDIVLVASGTATLMVGLMHKPMVIMYKMSSFTAWLAKRFVNSTAFFGMINLIHQRKIVPEFFQGEANPEHLAAELSKFITDPELRKSIESELKNTESKLGSKGITPRVDQALRPYFERG